MSRGEGRPGPSGTTTTHRERSRGHGPRTGRRGGLRTTGTYRPTPTPTGVEDDGPKSGSIEEIHTLRERVSDGPRVEPKEP